MQLLEKQECKSQFSFSGCVDQVFLSRTLICSWAGLWEAAGSWGCSHRFAVRRWDWRKMGEDGVAWKPASPFSGPPFSSYFLVTTMWVAFLHCTLPWHFFLDTQPTTDYSECQVLVLARRKCLRHMPYFLVPSSGHCCKINIFKP